MHVLAFDIDGKLETASDSLKANLKTYLSQYMLLTDAVNIRDAFVVNIGVKYDIVVLPGSIGRNVLLECNLALRNYLDNRKWSINQPINLSRVYTLLDRVKGVQTVKKIEITNKAGGRYSQYAYDIAGATKENVVYPSLDPCIFEVKFPETDIEGRITTL
jgi:phage-related baseplate assembly protein